jgi:hypothetical protein
MTGRRSLRRLQFYREATAGTTSAATFTFRGIGTILDNIQVQRVSEDVGIIGGTTRTNVPMKGGSLAISQTPATFENILHVLEMAIKTATPSQDGAGTDYIFSYAFPVTSGNTIKTYSIESGDDNEAERMAYCFVKDFTLSGNGRTAYQLQANIQGRAPALTTFTSAPALLAVNSMNFGLTKIYQDAIGGTIGTTIKSNTVRGVNFKFASGIEAKDTADGRLDFSFTQGTDYVVTCDLEFEHDAIAAAQKVLWRAETPVLLQVKVEGTTAFATPGTTYSVPTIKINLPGYWESFSKIGEANGNDVVTGKFVSAYNTTSASAGSVIVAVELATVP